MTQDPFIGRRLGAYLIQTKLGEGGMASVYKAYHDRLRREVALKVISAQIAEQADFRLRFEREAQLIASLEHRNIVTVYDFGEQQDLTYLVMQFVSGGTLRERFQSGRPLEPKLAAQYALQMALALHHAHQRGIVHRDVKPQNMLISGSDPRHLLLSDFGIAKLFDSPLEETWQTRPMDSVPANPLLTSADQMVGTAEYMAPEQINRRPVDARTDVYALGVVLYQMLTGYTPFRSTTVIGLLYQHVNTPPRPVREVNPHAPEVLAQITAKALQKAPEARFQSAQEFAQALEHALQFATHPLSASLGSLSGLNPAQSSFSTSPATSATNLPPTLQAPAVSSYGTQASYGTISAPHTPPPGGQTSAIRGNQAAIPRKKRSPFNLLNISTAIILLLALILLVPRVFPTLFNNSSSGNTAISGQSSTQKVDHFDENFANNNLVWLDGPDPSGHLTPSLQKNSYTLSIDPNDVSFFPYPKNVKPLAATFTLTASISQTKGDKNRFYGLSFYLKDNGQQTPTAYVFMINSTGAYALRKYIAGATNPQVVGGIAGTSSAIKDIQQENVLSVSVSGGRIRCSINGKMVGEAPTPASSDATFQNGVAGLFVTGPNTTFVVTHVKLER